MFLSRAPTGVGKGQTPLSVALAGEWYGMLSGASKEFMSGLISELEGSF